MSCDVIIITESTFDTIHTVTSSEVGPQGPPGPKGDTGDSSIDLAFQISNRFSEISEDEIAKQVARSNLGLSTIDGGTFF